jgi:hypothetical protein
MLHEMLGRVFASELTAAIFASVLLIGVAEIAFRFGLRLHRQKDEARKEQIGAIQGAMLGMVGLMLGFTFAMGLTHYDTRRNLVVREANAVGTTYLRASLLPEAHRRPVQASSASTSTCG